MEHCINQFSGKRVEMELSTGTRLMGRVLWIHGDSSHFAISDGGKDAPPDYVATRYVVRIREVM